MTLCAAWIRIGNADEGQELVFATDSRLSGGEAWDYGVKLFDLGRSDCLLCFAGDTERAYPLILHAGTSIRSNIVWSNPLLDIHDVLEALCQLFTDLCHDIDISGRHGGPDVHEIRAQATFLFGGWSWRDQQLCFWKLYYSKELEAFTHTALHTSGARHVVFLGDYIQEAAQELTEDLNACGKLMAGSLDMEPLRVLAKMARDRNNYPQIGGSLQVAKVYRSGNSEFFGMIWPSVMNGHPKFLGRDIQRYNAPPMRFIDPDTATFTESLPTKFNDLDNYRFDEEDDFVRRCYFKNALKPELTTSDRDRLERIFKDRAYRDFVSQREQNTKGASKSNDSNEYVAEQTADD